MLSRTRGDEQEILVHRYITAEQMIDLIVLVNDMTEITQDEVEVKPITIKEDVIETKVTKRGCGQCGKSGHNKKTCPSKTVHIEPESRPENENKAVLKDGEVPQYYNDVLKMLQDGHTDEEIYEAMRYKITGGQYRTALSWAEMQ